MLGAAARRGLRRNCKEQTNQVEAKLALKAASIESQYSRETKAERSRGRAILALRYLRDSIKGLRRPATDADHTGPSISPASMPSGTRKTNHFRRQPFANAAIAAIERLLRSIP